MSAPPPGGAWLPRAGPVSVVCDRCYIPGSMVLEHRRVWGAAEGLPQDPHPVAQGCPECLGESVEYGTRLVVQTSPPAGLAGVMPKLAASETDWVTCRECGHAAVVHWWPWLVCTTTGCGRQSRGRFHPE